MQALGRGDEPQPLFGVLVVKAVPGVRAGGGQETHLLVIAQRRRGDTAAARQFGDQQLGHTGHGKPSSPLEGQPPLKGPDIDASPPSFTGAE